MVVKKLQQISMAFNTYVFKGGGVLNFFDHNVIFLKLLKYG